MKKFFVRRENVGGTPPILIERLGSELFRGLAVVFRIADAAQNDSRRQGIILDLQFIHRQLDGGKLIIVIVNGEIPGQSGDGRLAPQEPGAKRMKCRKPRLRWRNSGAEQKL